MQYFQCYYCQKKEFRQAFWICVHVIITCLYEHKLLTVWNPARLCVKTPSNLMFFLFPSPSLPALGCNGDIEWTMSFREVRLLLCSHVFHRPPACPAACTLFAPPYFLNPIYFSFSCHCPDTYVHTTVHVPSCLNRPFSFQLWYTFLGWVIKQNRRLSNREAFFHSMPEDDRDDDCEA